MQQNDIDLTLAPASSATVHGTVTDGKSPIANTTVELFGSKGLPFQHTLTDGQGEYSMDGISAGTYSIGADTEDDGAFVFFDVPDGKYTLRSFADGYLPASPMTVTITGGSIANIPMSMNVNNRTYNGTVSGIIRDNNGLVVAACFVGLYQIVEQEDGIQKKLLVATTKKNEMGKHLLGNVNEGQYLVKAKKNK